MNGFLLDTDVISMLAPGRTDLSAEANAWLEKADQEGRLFLSVVSIHEIEKGIERLNRRGATAKAASLSGWVSGLVKGFDDTILSVDLETAQLGGRLEAEAISAGNAPGMADALIAGTAKAHDLIVVTRNARHFRIFSVEVTSPIGVHR
ncbi:MAG: type II toxin-antitoxin system VapC family toxin [Fulvimarina manganoxydans]|uniref:type II toxin-antitoxin system VapC family toxin n=1 Tax=Fulvimarina manganoxydans TaxID=937218 RepID=UPI002355FA16|nr:type II toxin-antitoxin system VapC family toxin [Fulvimarina manganoxydans]MCK5931650.1 type II toxin-antitoxin system VapC family toxin [Fulvimarina manganoxydans]